MRKWLFVCAFALLLSGCSAQETMETVADDLTQGVCAQVREISLTLPVDAAAPVSESETGSLYQCEGFEITVQTLPAGDLNATVQTLSGYSRENLTIMETETGGFRRYEFVWASAGETGDCLGQAAVIDDGNYHYAVSVLADEAMVPIREKDWQAMFDSFTVS